MTDAAAAGAGAGDAAGSPTLLFSTDVPNNVLHLDNVIVNEFHVLRRFRLISLCDEPVLVTLDSNLGSQLGFQLNNENLTGSDEGSEDAQNVANFLVDDFNELFNTVNLVNQVVLQPRQVQQVILTFWPLDCAKEMAGNTNQAEDADSLQRLPHEKLDFKFATEDPKHGFPGVNQNFVVNGKLFLSATGLSPASSAACGGCRQDIVVRFSASVCRSLLRTDVADIVFSDCVPGGVFVKDFSIWNLSEIPCSFQLHVKNVKFELPNLDLTDYDTGLPVTGGEIKSCAHRRIRVTFKPRDVGDFVYMIHLENNYDERNSISIPVQCLVNAEHRQEGILVTGVGEDGVLDFGDCYAENGTFQMLTLRNITQEALVVGLGGTDHAPGDHIAFYLQADMDISAASAKFAHTASSVQDALGKSLDSQSLDKMNRLEEILLERGEEKNILVWLYPTGAEDDTKAVKLQRRSYRISLKCAEKRGHNNYSKQGFSKIIQCKARVCTSMIKLSTSELNLGDCNVGSSKSATVEVQNLSDLPALISAHVTSTILSFKSKADCISLLPREAFTLDMEIVPLKINVKYRKQVRIDNLLNKGNQQFLEIRAKIMDRHHVLLHSLYYKLQTPSMNNLLSFGRVILNNPSVRILAIENVTDKDLVLEFSTSMPEELEFFELKDEEVISERREQEYADIATLSDSSEEDLHERRRAFAASMTKEKLLESLEGSQPRLSKSVISSTPFLAQQDGQPTTPPHTPSKLEKKPHNRFSFDLTHEGNTEYDGLRTNVSGSAVRSPDLHIDSVAHGKPLTTPRDTHVPGLGPMKRVQSSAMLLEGKEEQAEDPLDVISHEGYAEVIKRFSEMAVSACSFSEDEEAKKFVDRQIKDRELIMCLLEDSPRRLSSVERLQLHPGEKKALYVFILMDSQVYPSFQGRLQKLAAKVNIRLLEYDKRLQDQWEPGMVASALGDQIPARELPVHIKVCRAVLSLAQKNINFGKMFTNEHRAKTLVLNNNSDLPLLYKIKKTGSIASGDLHIIDGRLGVLLPHCNQEVNFVFQPSLRGSFKETLTVTNVYDPSNDQVVTLKATISRADTFWISTAKVDFGTIAAGEWCNMQRIIIRNTSKQTRTFMLRDANYAERSDLRQRLRSEQEVCIGFIVEPKEVLSRAVLQPDQEAIEALKRKILAFERKGKGEKAAKLWRQIYELNAKAGAMGGSKGTDPGTDPVPQHDETLSKQLEAGKGEKALSLPLKGWNGCINFTLKGGETQAVLVSCFVAVPLASDQAQRIQGSFLAYEGKDQDAVKQVQYEASVCPEDVSIGTVFPVLSKTDLANLPKLDLSLVEKSSSYLLSPSLSPESSGSANAFVDETPRHQQLETLDLHLSVPASNEMPLASGVDTSIPLQAGMWRSRDILTNWGIHPPPDPPTSVDSEFDQTGVSEVSSNRPSRHGSYDSLYPFEPLLKVEPFRSARNQAGIYSDMSIALAGASMDVSSAAELARSLSSIQPNHEDLQSNDVGFGLALHDTADHDGFEASFLLRSNSAQDIWVQLCLEWGKTAPEVELWVEETGNDIADRRVDLVNDSFAPGNLSDLSVWQSKETTRHQLPCSYMDSEDSSGTVLVASTSIRSGTVVRVQLYLSDQSLELLSHYDHVSSDEQPGLGLEKVTGLLTIKSYPSTEIREQISVFMGRLDRAIKVVPSKVVFPESDITSVLQGDVTIKNRTGKTIQYMVKVVGTRPSPSPESPPIGQQCPDATVQVEPAAGEIKAFGLVVIKLTCQPTKPGKQTCNLQVKSSQCYDHTQLSITMSPYRSHSLHLPDLPEGGTLDMGFCYMNAPGGMEGVPFRLENVLASPLSLVFKSNLARQVYISSDPLGTQRIDDIDLSENECRTVYMCLRPGGDAAAYENGQCREIIGGMRITVRPSTLAPIHATASEGSGQECRSDEIMVKFRAIVGWSLLQLSVAVIDLGRVEEIGGSISGSFVVMNPSSQMPLQVSISSQQASLSVSGGLLLGREVAKAQGGDAKADMIVEYSFPVRKYGLNEDRFYIRNLSCSGHDAEVLLRLFASNGAIEATVKPPLPHLQPACYKPLNTVVEDWEAAVEGPDGTLSSVAANVNGGPWIAGALERPAPSVRGRLRKALSTGEFVSGVSRVAEGNGGTGTGEYVNRIPYVRTIDFQDNRCLDLGIIFVSDNHSCRIPGPGLMGDHNDIFRVTDMRQYHGSCMITNYTRNLVLLQPVSDMPLAVHQLSQLITTLVQPSYLEDETSVPVTECVMEDYDHLGKIPMAESARQSASSFAPCGHPFALQPNSSIILAVNFTRIGSSISPNISYLTSGTLCAFSGLLAFQRSTEGIDGDHDVPSATPGDICVDTSGTGPEIAEVLTVKGFFCLSKGKILNEYIDLGKVGYANGWDNVKFNVDIENISDAELIYQIQHAPDCFMIRARDVEPDMQAGHMLPPRSVGTLEVTLLTSKLEQLKGEGLRSWPIRLLNCNNPHNLMEVVIEAEMTVRTLQFRGLTQSVLVLSPLTVPASPNVAQSVNQFTVENLSHELLGVALELHQVEETESLVTFEVFLSSTSTSVEEVRLGPGERIDLRVCARPTSDTIPAKFLGQDQRVGGDSKQIGSQRSSQAVDGQRRALEDSSEVASSLRYENGKASASKGTEAAEESCPELVGTFCLGHLYLHSSPHGPDCIPIHGALIQGPLFDVLPQTLSIQSRLSEDGIVVPERTSSLGKREFWQNVSISSDTLVVRNLRSFDSFHFRVVAELSPMSYGKSNAEPRALISSGGDVFSYLYLEPMSGSIAPHGSLEIMVKPVPWSVEDLQAFMDRKAGPEFITATIHVQEMDEDGSQGGNQSVLVSIRPPQDVLLPKEFLIQRPLLSSSDHDEAASEESVRPGKAQQLPVLGLRGCTPVSGSPQCYDFNLGQQNVSSGGRVQWDLTLIGDEELSLHYNLSTVSESDSKWLSISNCVGSVEPSEHKIIQLSFSTKAMGVYSTYLVVENLENPADLKMVHLSLEVVSARNARPDAQSLTFFHVLVEGDRTEGKPIDMGEVYYNFWYRNRSFVIVNEAPVAMEFLLSSSMDHNKSIELNFSLDNTSLKRFSSLTIDPKSSVRVWIHFWPGVFKGQSIGDLCDDRSAMIFVNCRLVKDYQRCIPFHASCRYPQIGISATDLVFSISQLTQSQSAVVNITDDDDNEVDVTRATGRNGGYFGGHIAVHNEMDAVGPTDAEQLPTARLLSAKGRVQSDKHITEGSAYSYSELERGESLELLPLVQTIKLSNLYLHRPLNYAVKNDSLFFETKFPEPQEVPVCSEKPTDYSHASNGASNECKGFHLVFVRPVADNLQAHREMILKQKYVEEHVTIYNRTNPREKYTVSLRITAGHLRNFFAALGSRNSYPFRRLERGITGFLSNFYCLTSSLLDGIQELSAHESQAAASETIPVVSSSSGMKETRSSALYDLNVVKWIEKRVSSFRVSEKAVKDYKDLFFDFQYLTDELVFYSLKERWSRGSGTLELAAVQLAKLLYCTFYRSQLVQLCVDTCRSVVSWKSCPLEGFDTDPGPAISTADAQLLCRNSLQFLTDWTGQLRHFLSYFPDSRDDLLPLRQLHQRIESAMSIF